MAELWGLYQGLCLAKNQGVLKLEVQIDSAVIVRREGSTTGWPFIKKRKLRPSFFADWDVKIIHVYQLIGVFMFLPIWDVLLIWAKWFRSSSK